MNSPLPKSEDTPKVTFAELEIGEKFVLLAMPSIIMEKQTPNARGTAFYRERDNTKVNVKVRPEQEVRRV